MNPSLGRTPETPLSGQPSKASHQQWADARDIRMVDFNSGLWDLLGRTPIEDFTVEDNGLSNIFYKYLKQSNKGAEGRTKPLETINQEMPFNVPYRTVIYSGEFNSEPNFVKKANVHSFQSGISTPNIFVNKSSDTGNYRTPTINANTAPHNYHTLFENVGSQLVNSDQNLLLMNTQPSPIKTKASYVSTKSPFEISTPFNTNKLPTGNVNIKIENPEASSYAPHSQSVNKRPSVNFNSLFESYYSPPLNHAPPPALTSTASQENTSELASTNALLKQLGLQLQLTQEQMKQILENRRSNYPKNKNTVHHLKIPAKLPMLTSATTFPNAHPSIPFTFQPTTKKTFHHIQIPAKLSSLAPSTTFSNTPPSIPFSLHPTPPTFQVSVRATIPSTDKNSHTASKHDEVKYNKTMSQSTETLMNLLNDGHNILSNEPFASALTTGQSPPKLNDMLWMNNISLLLDDDFNTRDQNIMQNYPTVFSSQLFGTKPYISKNEEKFNFHNSFISDKFTNQFPGFSGAIHDEVNVNVPAHVAPSTQVFFSTSYIDPSLINENTGQISNSNKLSPPQKEKLRDNFWNKFQDSEDSDLQSVMNILFGSTSVKDQETNEGLLHSSAAGYQHIIPEVTTKIPSPKPMTSEYNPTNTKANIVNFQHRPNSGHYSSDADFLSGSEEIIINKGFLDTKYTLPHGINKQQFLNSMKYELQGSGNFAVHDSGNTDVNNLINGMISSSQHTNNKFEIPQMLEQMNPPLPEHLVQMVHNISDILISQPTPEESLSEVFKGFREVFEHAGSILSGGKNPSHQTDVRPTIGATDPSASGNRLVIVYRPVLFVSHDDNGNWSRILGKGYRPSVLTGDGEDSEQLTKEVLNTLGPELLEKIREHFANRVGGRNYQEIERVPVQGKNQLLEISRKADKYIVTGNSLQSGRILDKSIEQMKISSPTYALEVKDNFYGRHSNGIRRHLEYDDISIKPLSDLSTEIILRTSQNKVNYSMSYDLNNPTHPQLQLPLPTSTNSSAPLSYNIVLPAPAAENTGSSLGSLPPLSALNPGVWWFPQPTQGEEGEPLYVLRRIVKKRKKKGKQVNT